MKHLARSGLDGESRRQLATFARQTALIAAICLPLATLGIDPLRSYLMLLRTVFGVSSAIIVAIALLSREPMSRTSLGVWDHGVAFLFLKLACSVALLSLD